MEEFVEEREPLSKRAQWALLLCWFSKGIAYLLAILSSLGAFIVIIVLAIDGTISVGLAIVLTIVGIPIVGTLAYWLAAIIGLCLVGVAKLLDRDIVTEWIDSESLESI